MSDDLSVVHDDYSAAETASLVTPDAWRVQRRMSAVIGIAALLAGYAAMVIFVFTLF